MKKIKISITFVAKIISKMVELDASQFLGLTLFMFILTAGFWLLIFLLTFVVPYWIGGTIWENLKLKKEAKQAEEGK